MRRHVPYVDSLRGKNIFAEFYDPEGQRYGVPTYPYHLAPDGLLTARQLRAKGLRPGGRDIAAQILWRHCKQCGKHWQIVLKPMRELIWATYQPGQEHDKRPSRAYLEAGRQARDYVMSRHGGS
jgi:hypothetical protein